VRLGGSPPVAARVWGALAAVTVAVVAVLGATTGAAGAHAVLISSTPSVGERLVTTPPEVSLTFSEGVSADLGGLTVLDSSGESVTSGAVEQPRPEQVRVPLQPDLADGTYLASYRVISGDGHPVAGTIVFAVGDVLDEASVTGLEQAEHPVARTLGDVARFLMYAGTLLLAGLAVFLAFLGDDGPERPRIIRLAQLSAVPVLIGTVAVVVAQAALATGLGLDAVANDGVLGSVLAQGGLGWSLLMLLVGVSLVLGSLAIGRRGTLAQSLTLYGGLLACGSFLLWGHTVEVEPRVVAGVADAVHVSVAAVWLGGLVGLGIVLRNRSRTEVRETMPTLTADGEPDPDAVVIDTAGIVIRFSTAAAVSVVLLVATGSMLAWQTVGSLDNLTTTPYGRTLTAKLLVVAVVLATAAWNRYRLVPHLLAEVVANESAAATVASNEEPGSVAVAPPPVVAPRWDRLASAVRFEVVGLVVALALTAVLVYQPPANAGDRAGDGPYATRLAVDDTLQVDLIVAPAVAGSNSFHITYLDTTGAPLDTPESASLRLRLPDQGVGPIEVVAPKAGVGHYFVVTDALAIAGTWEIELLTKLDEFTVRRTAITVPVGAP